MIKFLLALCLLTALSCTKSSRSIDLNTASNVVAFKTLKTGQVYGTGFHLSYKGKVYIVTNRHVCEATPEVEVNVNQSRRTVRVNDKITTILHISKTHDICIVKSSKRSGLSLSPTAPSALDPITLIGHPRGLPLIIRKGHIVGPALICINYSYGPICLLSTQISTLAYPGNSGSPVTNKYGQVIGILFAGNSSYYNEPFMVPYAVLKSELESLIK